MRDGTGKGYPYKLSGLKIPLSARTVAVADVYDALICNRPYKKAMKHEEAFKIIRDGSGTQFDPDIVNCFINIHGIIFKQNKCLFVTSMFFLYHIYYFYMKLQNNYKMVQL